MCIWYCDITRPKHAVCELLHHEDSNLWQSVYFRHTDKCIGGCICHSLASAQYLMLHLSLDSQHEGSLMSLMPWVGVWKQDEYSGWNSMAGVGTFRSQCSIAICWVWRHFVCLWSRWKIPYRFTYKRKSSNQYFLGNDNKMGVCGLLLWTVYLDSLFIVSEQLMEPLVNFDIKWQVCSLTVGFCFAKYNTIFMLIDTTVLLHIWQKTDCLHTCLNWNDTCIICYD